MDQHIKNTTPIYNDLLVPVRRQRKSTTGNGNGTASKAQGQKKGGASGKVGAGGVSGEQQHISEAKKTAIIGLRDFNNEDFATPNKNLARNTSKSKVGGIPKKY